LSSADSLKNAEEPAGEDPLEDAGFDTIPNYHLLGVSLDGLTSAFVETSAAKICARSIASDAWRCSDSVDISRLSYSEWLVNVKYERLRVRFPGAPSREISLETLDDIGSRAGENFWGDSVTLGLFSHLQAGLVRSYMAGTDWDRFAENMGKAAGEVWKSFAMDSAVAGGDSAGAMLALHAMLLGFLNDSLDLDAIAQDIADDGAWSDSLSRASLADSLLWQDSQDGFAQLREDLSTAGVIAPAGFEKHMRNFYGKELGLDACGPETAGSLQFVSNPASAYYAPAVSDYTASGERFVCNADGSIATASDSLKDTYGFGAGKSGEVRVGVYTHNRYYTFDGGWRTATAIEKDSFFVENSATGTFSDIQDVYEGIKPNERVIFILRHAERTDNTSKEGTLTDEGKRHSEELGQKLTKFEQDFLLGGSEFLRAHQTVEYIARGRGQQYDVRDTFPELNDHWYAFDMEANDKAKDECGGGWQSTSKYAYTGAYTTGDKPAFYKLNERTVELIEDVLLARYSDPSQRFVMLSSHDKLMVPLVVYCTKGKVNLRQYDGGKWLNYLAGIAIIVDELGNRRYVPVKGLDSAYM